MPAFPSIACLSMESSDPERLYDSLSAWTRHLTNHSTAYERSLLQQSYENELHSLQASRQRYAKGLQTCLDLLASTQRFLALDCIHPCQERRHVQHVWKKESAYYQQAKVCEYEFLLKRTDSHHSQLLLQQQKDIERTQPRRAPGPSTDIELHIQLLSGDRQTVKVSRTQYVADFADLFAEQNGYPIHQTTRMVFLRPDGDIFWGQPMAQRQLGKCFQDVLDPADPPLLYFLFQSVDDSNHEAIWNNMQTFLRFHRMTPLATEDELVTRYGEWLLTNHMPNGLYTRLLLGGAFLRLHPELASS